MASEIRLARHGDLATVGEVTVAAYARFTTGPDDSYLYHLRDAAARAEQAELWVAADDDEVLGSVTRCPLGSPWRELAHDDEGEFRMLAVAPHAQGRGVGEALVRHVVALDREAGFGGIVLSSLAEMTDAHRLYTRLGFARAPDRDWSPVPGVHLLAFHLRLPRVGAK